MQKLLLIILSTAIINACNSANEAQSQTDSLSTKELELPLLDKEEVNYIATEEDKIKFVNIIDYANSKNLKTKKIAEIEMEIAKQLLDIPYAAGTLEQEEEERLVINLNGLDCTTFLENVLAISFCFKSGDTGFDDYCKILTTIRYRNGKINKYPSRLHYFTDWLLDNEKKGLIKIVSNDFGNADFNPTVGFMSQNPDKYKKLRNNPEFVEKIAIQEGTIAKVKLKYITEDKIEALSSQIKDGDFIAFSTTIKGLDIAHVAIAAFQDGQLYFYHTSSSKNKVVLSENPMSEYLASIKTNDGILVARIIE